MIKRLSLFAILLFLCLLGYVVAYYPWLTSPRSPAELTTDWDNIETVAQHPAQCQKDWTALAALFQTAKAATRYVENRSDAVMLKSAFPEEWSTLVEAENDLYYDDSAAFFEVFQEELIVQFSDAGVRAISQWKAGRTALEHTHELTIFGHQTKDYVSLNDYIALMSDFGQDAPQKLVVELLQHFLTCGKMVEVLLGAENIAHLRQKASIPVPAFSLENEQLLSIIARELMGQHRLLETQNPSSGFLRLRPSSNGFSDYSQLPLILRSEQRDVWAWKDSTGQRFRRLLAAAQGSDFIESTETIFREQLHPLSSFDRTLRLNTQPLEDALQLLSGNEPETK